MKEAADQDMPIAFDFFMDWVPVFFFVFFMYWIINTNSVQIGVFSSFYAFYFPF